MVNAVLTFADTHLSQLTVNFASLILVFIGTVTVGSFPLKVLQLLWVRFCGFDEFAGAI